MTIKSVKICGGFLIALALGFCLPRGCGDTFGQEGQNPSATTIEVRAGEDAVITLEANHTTGFRWELAKPLDNEIIELSGTEYVTSETGMLGAGGKEVWTFKTLKAGRAEVYLRYIQPWEKDKPPAREAVFVIIVK